MNTMAFSWHSFRPSRPMTASACPIIASAPNMKTVPPWCPTTRTAICPPVGDLDTYLFGEGRHEQPLGDALGARVLRYDDPLGGAMTARHGRTGGGHRILRVGPERPCGARGRETSTAWNGRTPRHARAGLLRQSGSCSSPVSARATTYKFEILNANHTNG